MDYFFPPPPVFFNTVPPPLPPSPEMEASVFAVERILHYPFNNKRLLEEALTHSSCPDSASYERLEFLGDAVLGLAYSLHAFESYPQLDQGQLTDLRSANLSTEKLARVAIKHDLYRYVKHNASSLDVKICEFINSLSEEDDLVAHGGSVKAPKILADIVESIAAALYFDVKFDLLKFWMIFRSILEPIVTIQDLQQQPQPVAMMFKLCQKQGKHVNIAYSKKKAKIYVDGEFVASCSSEQKDTAKINAAKLALRKLSHSVPSNGMILDSTNGPFEIQGAKQKLHELCVKKKWSKPIYKIEKEVGPPHEKKFVCSVKVDNMFYVKGDEKTRVKDAENSAASLMIRGLHEPKE